MPAATAAASAASSTGHAEAHARRELLLSTDTGAPPTARATSMPASRGTRAGVAMAPTADEETSAMGWDTKLCPPEVGAVVNVMAAGPVFAVALDMTRPADAGSTAVTAVPAGTVLQALTVIDSVDELGAQSALSNVEENEAEAGVSPLAPGWYIKAGPENPGRRKRTTWPGSRAIVNVMVVVSPVRLDGAPPG